MAVGDGSVQSHPQSIPGQRYSGWQFFLIPVVVVMVGQVREVSLVGPDASGCGQSLVQAHVCGVWLRPQCVENGDLNSLSECHRRGCDLLAVAEIRQAREPALLKHQPRGRDPSVWQLEWGDAQVTDFEGPLDHMGLRVEITEGNGVPPEGIIIDPSQGTEGFLGGIDRQRAFPQVTDAPAVVHAHDVIGMRVGDEHRIEIAEFLPQHLSAKIRSGVDDQPDRRGFDVDRGAQPMVARVGQKGLWILLSDDGNPLRGACTQEAERERHRRRLRAVATRCQSSVSQCEGDTGIAGSLRGRNRR